MGEARPFKIDIADETLKRIGLTSTLGLTAAVERRKELALEDTGSEASGSDSEEEASFAARRNGWFAEKKKKYRSAFVLKHRDKLEKLGGWSSGRSPSGSLAGRGIARQHGRARPPTSARAARNRPASRVVAAHRCATPPRSARALGPHRLAHSSGRGGVRGWR